ncbi:hypothetical protein EDD18DRAFT_1171209 [Armillaria luteobubalina]|uniref:Uncharacterized protein n=1 Tax=Armillaria luteobubalina TaxID=153913 RepID=A0AA39Q2U0_9AGAR|nr:hypothetical protein EDD18DRAFT_1171209 [Armillaria luteobubalina]
MSRGSLARLFLFSFSTADTRSQRRRPTMQSTSILTGPFFDTLPPLSERFITYKVLCKRILAYMTDRNIALGYLQAHPRGSFFLV